jgi:excisionase family DNA binding protein
MFVVLLAVLLAALAEQHPALMERRMFRPRDLIAASGLSKAQIHRMLSDGRIRSVKVGRATLIPASAADQFFADIENGRFAPDTE